ncbi:amidohydrolase family protein [Cnuibacter sp. UC19_7]|uniref:amidohydrolase family protein n=1 Tax=Cnuibacter sp. UC19_7 TaxID=3350166 RepID=UPI00366CB8AE
MPTLWRDALVLTMDETPDGARPRRSDLLVDDGVIAAVGLGLDVPDGTNVRDGRDLLILPGLVNAHTHSWEILFRGTSERLPLELWTLVSYPPLGVEPLPDRLVYLRTAIAALESLRGGATAVLDDVGELPAQSPESMAQVFAAYDGLGIRAVCTGAVADIAMVDRLPGADELFAPSLLSDSRRALRPSTALIDAYLELSASAIAMASSRPGGRTAYAVSPSAPHRCSDDLLRACHDFAVDQDLLVHTHLLETRLQADVARERWGRTAVEHLDELGLLDERLVAAHGIWLTASDRRMLGAAGSTVAHNPLSNLKLGSGVLDWRGMRDAGVRLALGTDGASSSDTLRMLETVKAAALGQATTASDPESWPTAAEVLGAATRTGAAGLRTGAGVIAPGRPADLLVVDLARDTAFTPRHDVVRQLVFSADASSIVEVWVAGECVVREGHSTRIDDIALLREFREEAERWVESVPAIRSANERLIGPAQAAYRSARESTRFGGDDLRSDEGGSR